MPSTVTKFFDSILKDIIIYRQKNNIERNDLVNYLIELKRKSLEVEKGNVKSDLITRRRFYYDISMTEIHSLVYIASSSLRVLNNIFLQLTPTRTSSPDV